MRGRVGRRARAGRRGATGIAIVAALAAIGVGSTGAYFTGQVLQSGQNAGVGSFPAVATLTADKANTLGVNGQTTSLSWSDAKAQPWSTSNTNAAVTYTVKRSTSNDFSDAAAPTTVYTGTDLSTTDSTPAGPTVSTRGVSAVSMTVSNDGTFAIIEGKLYVWGYIGSTWISSVSAPTLISTPERVTHVAAGRDHACALGVTGRVFCVGYGAKGQLGNGGTADSLGTAVEIGSYSAFGGSKIVQITSGEYYTCALTAKGTIGCWGLNTWGQLGLGGSTTNQSLPVKVGKADGSPWPAIGGDYKPIQISAGAYAICALKGPKTDANNKIVLDANGNQTKPGSSEVIACWGRDNWNQLGAIASGVDDPHQEPVNIVDQNSVLTGVTKIASSHGVTCALTDNTAAMNIACWAGGGLGLLGNGSNNAAPYPVLVLSTSSVVETGFTDLSVSNDTACATRGSSYTCWGRNQNGQLGRGTTRTNDGTTADYYKPGPINDVTTVLGNDPIRAVSSSTTSTCVVSQNGGMACWGYNGAGNLAQAADTANKPSPVAAIWNSAPLVPAQTATQMASGNDSHLSAAIINGRPYYWGRGGDDNSTANGTLAIKSAPYLITSNPSPATASTSRMPTSVTQVTAGEDHICVLTATNDIWCMGNNAYGQLGDGTTTSQASYAVKVVMPAALQGKTIKKIDAGALHTCLMTTDATIACWGRNNVSQLGQPTSTASIGQPTIVVPAAPSSGVFSGTGNAPIDFTAGGYHVCVIKAAAGVACWGGNDVGQLGNSGAGASTATPVNVTDVGGVLAAGTVKAIDAGWKTTCLVASTGKPYCFGRNYWGELGQGSNNSADGATYTMTALTISGTFTGITIGTRMGCGWNGATAQCWGNNGYNELGRNGTSTGYFAPGAVVDTNNLLASGIVSLSSGWQHTCALTTTGSIACWGRADWGSTGLGTASTSTAIPTNPSGTFGTARVTGPTRTCTDGAAVVNVVQCSLAPDRLYYYQVTYTVGGADKWTSVGKVSARSGYSTCDAVFAANTGATFQYRLGEASGATVPLDYTGTAAKNGTYYGPMAAGAANTPSSTTATPTTACPNDAGTAYQTNGTSSYLTATSTTSNNPQAFTEALWFKTSTPQGKLIGFSNGTTAVSNAYDRQVYFNASGQLRFGMYNVGGATGDVFRVITTTGSYADGQWHHLAASYSSSTGMRLYVDGVLQATDPRSVSLQAYDGRWRLGGDSVSGWEPTNGLWTNAAFRYAAVYPSALSADEIARQYLAGRLYS